jgi:nickel-dependent lactate racemase
MVKFRYIFLIATLLLVTMSVSAKQNGKFARYSQITDKEVMLISNKGEKILFSAYDNNRIGFAFFDKNESVSLVLPSAIVAKTNLKGSVYVEELDELMQITTTSSTGMVIKIDKKNFTFAFVNKVNNEEIIIEEGLLSGIVSNISNDLIVEKIDNPVSESKITKM